MPEVHATYQLELGDDLSLFSATRLVPYLRTLGISHVCVPSLLEPRRRRLDAFGRRPIRQRLGGERGLRRLAATLHDAGMGLVMDVAATSTHPVGGADELDPALGDLLDQGWIDGVIVRRVDEVVDAGPVLRSLLARGSGPVWVDTDDPGRPDSAWPVTGTTGQDFLDDVTSTFVDPDGAEDVRATYDELVGPDATVIDLRDHRPAPAPMPISVGAAALAVAAPPLVSASAPGSGDDGGRCVRGHPPSEAALLDDLGLPTGVGSVDALHRANLRRLAHAPRSLLAASNPRSHRTADTRSRFLAISGLADEHAAWLRRAYEVSDHLVSGGVPCPAERWALLHTMIGSWPLATERIDTHLRSVVRDAALHSSWTEPDPERERRLRTYVEGLLDHTGFLRELGPFADRVARSAEHISVAQTVLRATVPGVPDTYQGDELWLLDLGLGEHRQAEWTARRRALDRSLTVDRRGPNRAVRKLHALQRALALRRRRPHVFQGGYTPLDAGPHTIAFTRGDDDVVVVVPVRRQRSAHVDVPGGPWVDVLAARSIHVRRGATSVAELTHERGVALLARP